MARPTWLDSAKDGRSRPTLVARRVTKPEAEAVIRVQSRARGTKLSEPLVLGITYPIQWHEPKVDLAELAKLRYLEGWSRQRLASHYGRTLNGITNYCQTIRRRDFHLPGLAEVERKKIRRAYQN